MASLIFNRGLQLIGDRASSVAGAGAAIQTLAVDDSTTAFTATDTNCGSPTNFFDKAFDATPTRSSQTVSHVATLTTGEYNQRIRRVTLHNDTTSNVTGSSNTLVAGIDGLDLLKQNTFSLRIQFDITYSSV
jgi:hypothetical protein